MLPHSFLFGHLIELAKVMMHYPTDLSGLYMPLVMQRHYPELFKQGVFYMDMWPITHPLLVVTNRTSNDSVMRKTTTRC